eukprot:3177004-Alexandrium_andersonii.AAC.1
MDAEMGEWRRQFLLHPPGLHPLTFPSRPDAVLCHGGHIHIRRRVQTHDGLSLIHISEPTRLALI